MKGIHEFIIQIKEPFKETFKTKGGLEIYGNKDFSADRLSNRIGLVINIPFELENTPIKIGYEVLVDPTIMYEQIYRNVHQESIHIVDKEKMWFRVEPKLIILYRENKNSKWKGFLENSLVKPIKIEQEKPKSTLIIMPNISKQEYRKDKAKLLYANKRLTEDGAKENDEVFINPNGGLPFWFDGKELWWIRNTDVLAIAV